jgi:hypothetical protein
MPVRTSEKITMKKIPCGLALVLMFHLAPAFADDDDNGKALQAEPFVFVGTAAGCGGTAGSNIVTSAWLTGMGLPDDGSTLNPDTKDPHLGLLLSKNGPTANCSSAGATITGADGLTVTELGFDYRFGSHCGAGSPRFNLTTTDNVLHVAGCANGTKTLAPQDPSEWARIRFTQAAQFNPPLATGAKIKSLSILVDEGTDSTTVEDVFGVGLSVVDNIDVNSTLITRGSNKSNNGNGNGDDDSGDQNDKGDQKNKNDN